MANQGLKPTLSQLLPLEKIPNELKEVWDAIGKSLRDIFDQLDALLAKASYGKKVPVKTLFDIIKE